MENVFLSIFSQLSPTNHNLARRGLSDSQNTLNMTKLKVNAQVTAITTLLEHIGNMTAIIHGVHFTTRSSWRLSILIHEMFCYCVFTPYVFLMNTSDNKNRIIKYGWRNVLKNIIGKQILDTKTENEDDDNDLPRPKKTSGDRKNDNKDTSRVNVGASTSKSNSQSIISKSKSDFRISSLDKSKSSVKQQRKEEQKRANPKNVESIKNISRNSSQKSQLLNVNRFETDYRQHGIQEAHQRIITRFYNP